jgi:dephospho-CoA kinase
VFNSDRVISLADIAMYTEGEDVPLMKVMIALRDKEEGKPTAINYRKASGEELRSYFSDILPDFDRDRVHDSDIRKLLQWYNLLIAAGITDFEDDLEPTEGDNVDDRKDQ